jgi:parallel beta-helix repeat protein
MSGFTLEGASLCLLTSNTADDTGTGFYVVLSTSCVLINNTASENGMGFSLLVSTSCNLSENTAKNNIRGIRLVFDSTGNLIFLNWFFLNSEYNAVDDGFSNHWDNGTHGNFWDDYDGSGFYNISGSAESVDNHPYLYDLSPPDDPTTTTIITTTTTSSTTSSTTTPDIQPWSLRDILVIGVSVVSASIIVIVMIAFIRRRQRD